MSRVDQSSNWTVQDEIENEAEKTWDEKNEKTPLLESGSESSSESSCFKWKKLKYVEPLPAIYMASMTILSPVLEQYVYLRISQSLGNNITNASSSDQLNDICNVNKSSDAYKIQQKTQSASSQFLMYLTVIQVAICTVPTIVTGNLVDRLGRKFALYLSFTSRLLYAGVIALVVGLDLPLYVLYVGSIIDGLSGSIATAMMAFSTYIADVTLSGKERGFRMTVLECIMGLTAGIGSLVSGLLIRHTNFLVPMLVCLVLIALALVYIRFLLAETFDASKHRKAGKEKQSMIKKTFHFYLKETPNKRRSRLLLGLTGFFFTVPSVSAAASISMLYVLNLPFCWTSDHIGIYGAVQIITSWSISVTLVKFLQRYWSDMGLAILGNASNVLYYLVMAFAKNDTTVYIAAVMGTFSLISLPNLRSTMSKMVQQDEHGSLFAGISFVEMISTIIFVILCNMIYSMTLSIMPGIVYLFLSALMLSAMIAFIASAMITRKLKEAELSERKD